MKKCWPARNADALEYVRILIKAVLILIIGRFLARFAADMSGKLMARSGMDGMLYNFLRNIIYSVLLAFVVIAPISALGIQRASLVAVIGAAGIAIGFALQGSLANFAAGVLMIIFRPYKLNDLVNVTGTEGFVEEVDVFTTVLRLPDKTKIIIPNGQIMSDKIINYIDANWRRMECIVGISYGASIDEARNVILAAAKESKYVVTDPEPQVTVTELGDSSVNLALRPWVESASYAPASHEINERVKKRWMPRVLAFRSRNVMCILLASSASRGLFDSLRALKPPTNCA